MDLCNPQALLLMAATRLGISSHRVRLLATGDVTSLREWIEHAREMPLVNARSYARRTADRLQSIGARIVTLAESGYPAGLRLLPDPPAFLTYRGTIDFEGVTIVGSRTPPAGATEFAYDLAYQLGHATVSGLALGIDAAVHRGSVAARFPTLAYVGTGIDRVYPVTHQRLQEEIIACGGGVASEHLPHQKVSHANLVRRDRLQAAHGIAIVLVASEASGGAMQTMRFAKNLHKPRFAVELAGRGYDGNRQAIKAGATLVTTNVDDVVRELRRPGEDPHMTH